MERLKELAKMDPDGRLGFLMLEGLVNPSANPNPGQMVWVTSLMSDAQALPQAQKTIAIANIATYINSCR